MLSPAPSHYPQWVLQAEDCWRTNEVRLRVACVGSELPSPVARSIVLAVGGLGGCGGKLEANLPGYARYSSSHVTFPFLKRKCHLCYPGFTAFAGLLPILRACQHL